MLSFSCHVLSPNPTGQLTVICGSSVHGIKSDSATSQDCATWLAQLFGRIAQLGLRNLDCATPRIAQLSLRNSQDCATLLAQLSGLRNSACATLRIAQLVGRIAQLFDRIAQLSRLRNFAFVTLRIEQICLRKS